MIDFPIVDSHVHLWNPGRLKVPWLKTVPKLDRAFLMDDFDAHRGRVPVEKVIFLECDLGPAQYLEEAAWVASLAREEPRIAGIVAHAPLHEGDGARPALERLAAIPGVKGVRRLIQSEADTRFCVRPDFVAGVRLLPDYGMRFDLCIYHRQMGSVVELVRQCPEVSFVLDHVGKPGILTGLLDPWRQNLRALASFGNVMCKLSGMATEADHARWTEADLRPYIDYAIDCFGFDRVMYGGDWPVATLATDYPRWVETLYRAVEEATGEERRKLFRENAIRFYGL